MVWNHYGLTSLIVMLIFMLVFYPVQAEELRGGELVMIVPSTPPHLNPAITSGALIMMPAAQLFASPLRYDNQWQPQPYLAEHWEVAEDGLSVTLHLAPEATFHDGQPITSKDIEFSINLIKANHPFQQMFAPVKNVETPDDHIAIIRLKHPHPSILLSMSSALLPILPKHIYGDGQDIQTHPANQQPIGSGPFKLKEFIPKKSILLERYDDFFLEGRPYLDQIRMIQSTDPNEVAIGLETGEIHLWESDVDIEIPNQLAQEDHLHMYAKSFEAAGPLAWVAFNLRKPPFDDHRVRQAIAYAIDRDLIIETLFQGQAKQATGPLSSSSPFYTDDVELYKVDFDKANALLDEAGYLRDQKGKRFSFELIFFNNPSGTNQKILTYLHQVFLRKLGVEVKYGVYSFGEWAYRVANWEFEATIDLVFNWGDPVIGVHRTYMSSNIRKGVLWSNTQGYHSHQIDTLLERAATERDFVKRKALYREFQKIITHDLPVYGLYELPIRTIKHKDLMNINQSIWGAMSPMDEVYWKK